MSEDTITAVEVVETDFGEKVVLDSPFDAKDFIKVLPWNSFEEEVEEHGSLGAKAVSRGMSEDNVAIQAAEDFDFSDGFATHVSWEPDALQGNGAWTIDAASLDEATEFFEHCGFEVENQTSL